jgi:ribose transport system permease protein
MTTTAEPQAPVAAKPRRPLPRVDSYVLMLVWIGVVVLFGLLEPETFLTELTFKTILADQAITCALAVGVTLALAAGVIDLSFAAMAGLSMVLVTSLSENGKHSILLSSVFSVLACVALGLVIAALVTWLRVNSLIATLGMLSVASGLTAKVTGGVTLTGTFSATFTAHGQGYWGPFPRPFVYAMVLAAIAYVVLEHTVLGRRLLAVGSNADAARLAGMRVPALQVGAILTNAAIAGLAGVILAAKVGQATDSTGSGYLLPVVAAVFLGSTQLKNRVNVIGSIVAVLTLGTGIKGLQLMGTTPWVTDFFNGAVLLAAVAFGALRTAGSTQWRALRARSAHARRAAGTSTTSAS